MQLREFFAVVLGGSVYRVRDGFPPGITQITTEAGRIISHDDVVENNGYPEIGITESTGLVLFRGSKETRDAEQIDPVDRGCATRSVVALFLDQDEAFRCAQSVSYTSWDARWRDETKAVLQAIGDAHPHFSRSVSILKYVNV